MEQSPKYTLSGISYIPIMGTVGNEEAAWRYPRTSNSFHASSDASLFSASLPAFTHEKFKFNESDSDGQQPLEYGLGRQNNVVLGDEVKYPGEDSEPHMAGSFLPGDEDELLAGVMDDFDFNGLPTKVEDLDDDLFGSGGGLEIESESQSNLVSGLARLNMTDGMNGSSLNQYGLANGPGTVTGEHPYGEHPSRTLFVRNINSNVEDSELRSLFEQYGDIRTLYTACKQRGFVMISYYDIRAARTAMRGLQNKPLRRRKLDIHFSIPKDNPSEKDINQGTLVVFNLDASVSNDDLRQIFGAYGEVKEIRETPHKRHHKFIEYYDVRAAEAALKALNRCDIAGKRIKLEPSRPGGARRSLMQQLTQDQEQDEGRTFRHQLGSPIGNSPPGSWPNIGSPVERNLLHGLHGYSQSPTMGSLSPVRSNHLSGLASILQAHASNSPKIAPIGGHRNPLSYQHHFSVPDMKISSSPGPISLFGDSKPSSVGTLTVPQFLWGSPTTHSEQSNSSAWSSSFNGRPYRPAGQGIGFPFTNHHAESAPSGIQLEKHFGFYPESPETSYMNRGAIGTTNFSRNNGNHVLDVGPHGAMNVGVPYGGNFSESGSPSSRMGSMPRNGPVYFGNGSLGGMGVINNDVIFDRGRSRKLAENGSHQIDNKKQYQLDLEKIVNGDDNRTTLMIKNIPNKYTSKMLLAAIDETHKGAYDFLYLPIDFKNKCNVGYAFINMVSPSHIISFYETFNGMKWEKFNSEKVASLAYARIQGKTALVSHFQNSSLINEDKSCRPILFHSDGQGNGNLEPIPTGNLNIFIRQPDGSYAGDSLDSPTDDPDENLFLR